VARIIFLFSFLVVLLTGCTSTQLASLNDPDKALKDSYVRVTYEKIQIWDSSFGAFELLKNRLTGGFSVLIPGVERFESVKLKSVEGASFHNIDGLASLILRGKNGSGNYMHQIFNRSSQKSMVGYIPSEKLWIVESYNNKSLLASTSNQLTPETYVYTIKERKVAGPTRYAQLSRRDANRMYDLLSSADSFSKLGSKPSIQLLSPISLDSPASTNYEALDESSSHVKTIKTINLVD
jgi:hypothetical protein